MAEQEMEEEYVKIPLNERLQESANHDNDYFKTDALKLIDAMIDLGEGKTSFKGLLAEMLHSIFFLGLIHEKTENNKKKKDEIKPEEIISENSQLMKTLKEMLKEHSDPFTEYNKKLPKRTPFSCFLDQVVSNIGEENEDDIKKDLSDRVKNMKLKRKNFVATCICISQKNLSSSPKTVRYYGASMSCKGKKAGQIMVAVSCLHTWHYCVSNAVMTYRPDKRKRENFDGTMTLAESVRCQAFNVWSGKNMDPCKSCVALFGLNTPTVTSGGKSWAYGNCAEVESLSKFLYDNVDEMPSVDFSDLVREQVREEVKAHLVDNLNGSGFILDLPYCGEPHAHRDTVHT